MKVRELIAALEQMPGEADVLRFEPGYETDDWLQPACGCLIYQVLAPGEARWLIGCDGTAVLLR